MRSCAPLDNQDYINLEIKIRSFPTKMELYPSQPRKPLPGYIDYVQTSITRYRSDDGEIGDGAFGIHQKRSSSAATSADVLHDATCNGGIHQTGQRRRKRKAAQHHAQDRSQSQRRQLISDEEMRREEHTHTHSAWQVQSVQSKDEWEFERTHSSQKQSRWKVSSDGGGQGEEEGGGGGGGRGERSNPAIHPTAVFEATSLFLQAPVSVHGLLSKTAVRGRISLPIHGAASVSSPAARVLLKEQVSTNQPANNLVAGNLHYQPRHIALDIPMPRNWSRQEHEGDIRLANEYKIAEEFRAMNHSAKLTVLPETHRDLTTHQTVLYPGALFWVVGGSLVHWCG